MINSLHPAAEGERRLAMGYSYLENLELEEALAIYTDYLTSLEIALTTEKIPVTDALGRVTSEAVYAKISAPHYNACAMDGLALLAKSTFGATDTTPVMLKEGIDFVRIDTGDPLPERFDAVVMIEEVIELADGMVKLLNAATPWQHIRQIGEDLCASEMIIPSNTRIGAAAIGAMLAGGVLQVMVWKKPVIGLIPTGDEIVRPTDCPGAGEIIEYNTAIFAAMLVDWGATSKIYAITPDRFEQIRDVVTKAAAECDLVILNAGSSAGREDFSAKAIGAAGKVIAHGIAIRPGKPTILGVVNNRPVVGVPGYPVSGMMVMEKMFKRILENLTQIDSRVRLRTKATLSRKIVSSLKYKEFIRMKLGKVDGRLIATPLNRGAGVVTSLVKADGLLEIPINSEGYEAGQEIEVELLKSAAEIQNTLVVIGSHDPLLDVVSDLMRRKYPDHYVASAHVGSMGGIMAVKRGEAHSAGIHLLDEATGEYNTGFIRRYLQNEKILRIQGVQRVQGLMVAAGNPKKVTGLKDIARDGVRYVNRQKGSGTRILLDYLLRKDHISVEDIYGYEREEFTHMSVATLVASGSADAGMGIYAAAKVYGLDFIPLSEEEYDFIMPARFGELEIVKHFLKILESEEFQAELKRMGGYQMKNPGKIQIIDPC